MRSLAALASVAMMFGCITPKDRFVCSSDDQCVQGTDMGVCDPSQSVCAFPDTLCESGTRFGDLAGDLSGECTSVVISDAGPPENLRFVAVVAGAHHTCALEVSGRVFCWGDNQRGQAGNGSLISSLPPTEVSLAGPAYSITAGNQHTCALVGPTAPRDLYCWGDSSKGQVGAGMLPSDMTATPQMILASVAKVDAGAEHTCTVMDNGDLYCWGSNESGQIGDGNAGGSIGAPLRIFTAMVADATVYERLALGGRHSCAVNRTKAGAVQYGMDCWGNNENSQLGVALPSPVLAITPTLTPTLAGGAISPSAGGDTTCFVRNASLSCYGDSTLGQAGVDPASSPVLVPTEVKLSTFGATQVGVGAEHTCASSSPSGFLHCFGLSDNGELGIDSNSAVPVSTPTDTLVVISDSFSDNPPLGTDPLRVIAVGKDHSCAVVTASTDRVWCWGDNSLGQTGLESPDPQLTPVEVAIPRP